MKNRVTLIIASVLLVLCVIQKEARYGSFKRESVEKMYNFSAADQINAHTAGTPAADQLLTDSQTFEFTASDSSANKGRGSAHLVNQSLLNISSSNKVLNY